MGLSITTTSTPTTATTTTSITSLPTELLLRIFGYVFQHTHVRLQYSTQTFPFLPTSAPLLTLQLVCKSWHANLAAIYSEFLRSATIEVSDARDVEVLSARFGRERCALVRHLCICASGKWETHAARRHGSGLIPRGEWWGVDVRVLKRVFPGVRSLGVRQYQAHVNTFCRTLNYSVGDLMFAKWNAEKENGDICGDGEIYLRYEGVENGPATSRSDDSLQRRMKLVKRAYMDELLAVTRRSKTDAFCSIVLDDFAYTLYACIEQTAFKYGTKWYKNLLRDVVGSGIEMAFDLELLFEREIALEPSMFDVYEQVRVSTKDWVLKLTYHGKEHEFLQLPPDGCADREEMREICDV